MGRVVTEAKIENLADLLSAQQGLRSADQVRAITVQDALVDTGASSLALPRSMLAQLGLSKRYDRRVRTATGTAQIAVYDPVRLTIQGRDCTVDTIEVPDDIPVLVGQIPLEFMDFVGDPASRRLIGNPAHGGEQTLELY